MQHCDRCGRETIATIMSRFNTDILCPACDQKERAHPRYPHAAEAERRAVERGDYNYPGVGKPNDL